MTHKQQKHVRVGLCHTGTLSRSGAALSQVLALSLVVSSAKERLRSQFETSVVVAGKVCTATHPVRSLRAIVRREV